MPVNVEYGELADLLIQVPVRQRPAIAGLALYEGKLDFKAALKAAKGK